MNVSPRTISRSGFTLVELLLGLALTGLVMAAMASLTLAVSTRWNSVFPAGGASAGTLFRPDQLGNARLLNRLRDARVLGLIRAGSLSNPNQRAAAMLWRADDNANGSIELDEMGLIEFDAVNQKLCFYRAHWPVALSASARAQKNVTYSYAFLTSTTAPEDFKRLNYVGPETLLTSVASARFNWLAAAAGGKPALEYRIAFTPASGLAELFGQAALRAPGSVTP